MKKKAAVLILAAVLSVTAVRGQLPVFDAANLANAIERLIQLEKQYYAARRDLQTARPRVRTHALDGKTSAGSLGLPVRPNSVAAFAIYKYLWDNRRLDPGHHDRPSGHRGLPPGNPAA